MTTTHKNGCFNRKPFATTQKVQGGYFDDGFERTGKLVPMPFNMASDCQYTLSNLGKVDPYCVGCIHKK